MLRLIIGYPYLSTARLLKKTEFLPREELDGFQRSYLAGLLWFAARSIPFYADVSLDGIDGGDTLSMLERFPLIDKQVVSRDLRRFIGGAGIRNLKATSGGSTGQPSVFYVDRLVTRQREKAFMFDQWSRAGYRFGRSIFNIRGRTPPKGRFIIHDRLFNTYYASSLELNRAHIDQYVSAMNEIRPEFLHGYPSTVYQLALLLEGFRKKLNFRFHAVLCGSEKLFDFQRRKIEAVFECRTYHWYGHSECLALGGECEYSNTLHFYPQYGYTELGATGVKDDKGRDIYEIIATGFNNRVMPLIRYRTGDYAVPALSRECKCGRHYFLIEDVIGREQEFVVDREGTVISATSLLFGQHYEIFEGLESVKLGQDRPGTIEVLLVKGERFKEEALVHMKEKMKDLLGDRMTILFSFHASAERTPIGKAKLVDQKLDVRSYLQD